MKDKASIQRKWEKKIEEMRKKAEFKYKLELQKKQNQWKKDFEYLTIKVNKKRDAYISKKEKEYHKRMLNEIRELEGKEVKPIKKKKNLNQTDFAAKIMQENSRLRDSDADGVGYCISCDIRCSWENHQWGHLESRRIQNLILEPKNINLQCKSCNFATWPQGDTLKKAKVNHHYSINLDKKYGEWTSDRLRQKKIDYLQNKDSGNWDFSTLIPELIEENKRLWATKNFYKPSQNWEWIWNKYPELHKKETED